MPPEFVHELDALRRRAYGLDADIDCDPIALRRLGELEAALHPRAAPAPEPSPVEASFDSHPDRVHPAAAIRDGAPPLVAAKEPDELLDPLRHSSPPRPERHLPSLRGVTTIVAAIGALGLAASILSSSRGDVVLTAAQSSLQQRQDLVDEVDLASIGMIGARLQPFADFRDISVWSAVNSSGVTCLLVGSDREGDFQIACTPAPLQPSLDLRVGDQVRPGLVGGLPAGSVVRLVLHGDDVGVWIAEALDLND